MSERNCLAATTRTDRSARSGDRASEVSRGHSSLETLVGLFRHFATERAKQQISRDRRAKRRPERSPAISGVNGVASTNENS